MVRILKKEEFQVWIGALLLFLISYPKWMWGFGSKVLVFLYLLFFIISFPKIKLRNAQWMKFAYLLQVIFLLEYFTSGANLAGILLTVLTIIGFVPIYFCEDRYWKSVVDKYIIILAILLIPTLIEFVLIIFFPMSHHSIAECPINVGRDYYVYTFNVNHLSNIDFSRFRFYAFYDEPGVLANILFVLLFLQKFNLKKWFNFVFLISGLLTFSLAFYFATMVYFIIVGKLKIKILFIFIASTFTILLCNNSFFYDILFSRMVIENGTLSGYDRENVDFEIWFSHLSISDYLFGYIGKVVYAASWKWAFVKWGVIPCLFYFIAIFKNALRMHLLGKDLMLIILIIVIIWIQRPFLQLFLYPFLMIIPLYYYSSVTKEKSLNSLNCE